MPRKRTNTAVWLEKYSRWQINVQKDGIRRTFTSSTPGRTGQREANAKADAWLEDGVADTGITVNMLFDQWIETLKSETSYSHWSQYETCGKVWIKPRIGTMKIGNVNESHLQKILDDMNKKGRAKKTIMNMRGCLTAFIKYARIRKCSTLHMENLHVPKSAEAGERTILKPEDLAILFSKDTTKINRGEHLEPFINAYRFEVATGLRPGEVRGLMWSDISGNTITILRSVNRHDEFTKGKNKNARRSFALTSLDQMILDRQKQYLSDADIHSDYIFPEKDGGWIKYVNYYEHWVRYCDKEGLSKVHPYELRHTFVSLVKTLPEGYLKDLIGHSEDMDSYGTYSHEMKDDKDDTARLVQSIFDKYIPANWKAQHKE